MNAATTPGGEQVDRDLLEIVVCPACRSGLDLSRDAAPVLRCTGCGLRYPVREGIPVLLVDEATRPS